MRLDAQGFYNVFRRLGCRYFQKGIDMQLPIILKLYTKFIFLQLDNATGILFRINFGTIENQLSEKEKVDGWYYGEILLNWQPFTFPLWLPRQSHLNGFLHYCQFGEKKLQAGRSPTIHLPHGIKKECVLHYQIKDSCEYKKASIRKRFLFLLSFLVFDYIFIVTKLKGSSQVGKCNVSLIVINK